MENLDGDWLKGGIEYKCVCNMYWLAHTICQIWLGNIAECHVSSWLFKIDDNVNKNKHTKQSSMGASRWSDGFMPIELWYKVIRFNVGNKVKKS